MGFRTREVCWVRVLIAPTIKWTCIITPSSSRGRDQPLFVDKPAENRYDGRDKEMMRPQIGSASRPEPFGNLRPSAWRVGLSLCLRVCVPAVEYKSQIPIVTQTI